MSTINWSDLVKQAGSSGSTNYEPLPDGDYELKVIQAVATTTQTGKVMFKVTNEVQGGPYAKRRIWDQLVVTTDNSKAMQMFFMKVTSMGIPLSFFEAETPPTNAQIEQALLGRTFRATVGKRLYNGTESNEIRRYYKLQTPAQGVTATTTAGAAVPPPPPAPSGAPAPAPSPAPAAPISADEPF